MKKKKTKQYAKNKLDFKEVLKQMQKKEDVILLLIQGCLLRRLPQIQGVITRHHQP